MVFVFKYVIYSNLPYKLKVITAMVCPRAKNHFQHSGISTIRIRYGSAYLFLMQALLSLNITRVPRYAYYSVSRPAQTIRMIRNVNITCQ